MLSEERHCRIFDYLSRFIYDTPAIETISLRQETGRDNRQCETGGRERQGEAEGRVRQEAG